MPTFLLRRGESVNEDPSVKFDPTHFQSRNKNSIDLFEEYNDPPNIAGNDFNVHISAKPQSSAMRIYDVFEPGKKVADEFT